jgi:hypothetical protein
VILFGITGLVAAPSPGCAQASDPQALESLSDQPLKGKVATETLPSKALGRKARFVVYEPPEIVTGRWSKRQPSLTIYLHGVFEDETRWLRRGAPQRIEAEILSGRIGPTVVVAPEGRLSFWVDAPEPGHAWRRFLLEELLPHLEIRYRTRAARDGRRLIGVSMGGYAALGMALAEPEAFGAVAAAWPLLPTLDPADPDPEADRLFAHWSLERSVARIWGAPRDPEAWRRSHPLALAEEASAAGLPALEIVTPAGAWPGQRMTTALLTRLAAFEPTPRVLEVKGAPGWELLDGQLPAILRFLDQSATRAPESRGDAGGKEER